jgi:hypothetical protein
MNSGRLAKVFGGSGETAYILVYRSVELNSVLDVPIAPAYWSDYLSNDNATLAQERATHAEMTLRIEVTLLPADLFVLSDEFLAYKTESAELEGEVVGLKLTDPVSRLRDAIAEKFGDAQAFEVSKSQTAFLHVERSLDALELQQELRDAKVSHKSIWLIVPTGDARLNDALAWVGQDCEPIELLVNIMEEPVEITVVKAWTLAKLQEIISERTGIDSSSQRIRVNLGGTVQELNTSDQDKTLGELKLSHKAKVSVSLKESAPTLSESAVIVESVKGSEGDVSILVYDEQDPEQIVKHCKVYADVSLEWKLKRLLSELKQLFHIEGKQAVRVRKLMDNSVFTQEQLNIKLDRLGFEEGGLRLQLERGNLPRQGEIVVRVGLESSDESLDVFTNPRSSVGEL